MEAWRPEGAAHVFIEDPTHPDQDLQQQAAFLQCYSIASWHVNQWLATLPQPQRQEYAPFCLPPLPLHDARGKDIPGQSSLLEPSRLLFASGEQRQLIGSRAKQTSTPFEMGQIYALLEASVRSPYAARDVALLALLLETGMRVSELAALTWQDVRLEEPVSSVWRKGRKDGLPRRIPLSPQMREALLRYHSSLDLGMPPIPAPETSEQP